MEHSIVFAGIDYASSFVQVCILDRSGRQLGNRRCANVWREIAAFFRPFGTEVRASIEASTGAASLAEELLQHADWSIDLRRSRSTHGDFPASLRDACERRRVISGDAPDRKALSAAHSVGSASV